MYLTFLKDIHETLILSRVVNVSQSVYKPRVVFVVIYEV